MTAEVPLDMNVPEAPPAPAEQIDAWARAFTEDGFVHLPGLLAPAEVDALREGVLEAHRHPCPTGNPTPLHRHQMFRRGPEFAAMLDREPVVSLAERLLGDNCHVIANNTIYTAPGMGVDHWHVDETVLVPVPEGARLPDGMDMPCFIVTAMYYLNDVPMEVGPTQIVPGSHRSGRPSPTDEADLVWDGRRHVSLVARAGDCVVLNGQTWHRGATNRSDHHRIVLQVTYGRRYISQRFWPYVNFTVPEEISRAAPPRRRRLLGEHSYGPYG
ncbi:phytanoyl-CoA dioxygenase family protein [Actinomadura verrucosospora]|uniref:Mitomycin antibiotics/polyketide fumonisin biosynthesis protein n=1 Tax=Actinomadura verrucosospora TaxID=46165 RepID=A0A7D3VPB6_ACTVE|nr:phytanoyl-CoA dioxygenase family protein [Actinomadura verrucosospora]QKG18659.1 mitomycin antibiotics/polyketide fumonisin biosynthesis protein [Actinomadura verrucosospora]